MVDKFIEQLCFGSSKRNVIQEIKDSNKPLVVWGNGVIAHIIMDILEKYKLTVSLICVDVGEDADEFRGIAIKGWDEIDELYDSYDVIVGHSSYELGHLIEMAHNKIHKMFYFPSVDYGYELFDEELMKRNLCRYREALEMLEDDESRAGIIAFLNTRMTGDISYVLDMFNKKSTFFTNDAYSIGSHETYWDIGACNGDTIDKFLGESQMNYEQIVALEPDAENMKKLKNYVEEIGLKEVYTFEAGAWECKTELLFEILPNKCSRIIKGDSQKDILRIKVEKLDSILESNQNIKPPTLLKFDYGSGVKEGLIGASKILTQHLPKIAVGIGFDECSFIDIIKTIKSINSNYKLYVRFNTGMASTIFLCGICKGESC